MRWPFLALFFLLVPAGASAQMLDFSSGLNVQAEADPFSINVHPRYPGPYETVTVSLVAGAITLNAATIVVSSGGRELYRGSQKPVAVSLGRGGAPVAVRVQVTAEGRTYAKTVTIVPQEVAIVAEPAASAPVLYKGKPLVPLEGVVRVIAMANLRTAGGRSVDPSTLSYAWSVDGVQKANASGIGRTSTTIEAPLQYRERAVSVTVTSQDGTLVGGASTALNGNEPILRLYENDPLLGIRFERALRGEYVITGTESSVYAAPYSFPADNGVPLIEWFLNGTLAQTGNSVTLRPTGSGQGGASLSAVATGGQFSKATAQLSLTFGEGGGFNFFGL